MRRGLLLLAGLLLALAAAGCTVSPYVRDPGCRARFDDCVAGCRVGPPESPFGAEQNPSFEQACRNGCYTDARACQGFADERAEPPAAPPEP